MMIKTELEDVSHSLTNIISKFPHAYSFRLSGIDKLATPTQHDKSYQYSTEQQLIFV